MAENDPWEEVEIIRDVDLAELKWLSDKNQAGSQNREYEYFRGYSWEDVQEALAQEEALLDRRNRLNGEALDEFDSRVLDIYLTDDDWEEWVQQPWGCLDIGVASAVVALSAAGCWPESSCNGGRDHLAAFPVVAFWCKPAWVPVLLSSAEEAECGLENSDYGTLAVYALDSRNLLSFARALLARRSTLGIIGVRPVRIRHNKHKKSLRKRKRRQLRFFPTPTSSSLADQSDVRGRSSGE